MARTNRWVHGAGLVLAIAAFPAVGLSQPARRPGEFETYVPPVPSPTDDTRLRVQAGASLATGNTRSFAGNLAGRFLLRRGNSQLTIDGAMNYGRASVLPAGADPAAPRADATTAENYLGRLRFDQFFFVNNAIYVAALGFRDQPSGFDARISGQIGYLRNVINSPGSRRLWAEIGYDLTYENLTGPATPGGPDERVLSFARGFVGFEEHATPALDLTVGIEALLNIAHPTDFRVNATIGAASKIGDDFSLALSMTVRYLSEPIGGRESLDTLTLVSVIYQRQFQQPVVPVIAAAH